MLNLNQLRAFYQVAKWQSFSLAAKHLFVSQPAVNSQVKLFEETCGVKLLVPKGRKMHLTEEGKALFEQTRKLFEAEKKIEAALEELRQLGKGTLRLGTARTYGRYFMPLLVSTFHQAYPQIGIHLSEGTSRDMRHSLHDLENQLAILSQTDEDPRICFVPFCLEEVILLLAPDHPLAKKRAVAIADLARESLIMKEKGSGTRRIVDKLLAEHGIEPNILMETSDAEMIKMLVRHGEGVSFLVRVAAMPEIKEKKLATVRLQGASIHLDVGVAYLAQNPLSPSARAFLATLQGLMKVGKPLQTLGELNTILKTYRKSREKQAP